MTSINPNNWHYTVDSGVHEGDVVVPLSVVCHGIILCSVQFGKCVTSKIGDHISLDPKFLTRLDESDFEKYNIHPCNSKTV